MRREVTYLVVERLALLGWSLASLRVETLDWNTALQHVPPSLLSPVCTESSAGSPGRFPSWEAGAALGKCRICGRLGPSGGEMRGSGPGSPSGTRYLELVSIGEDWLSWDNSPWDTARGRLAFARILPRSRRFGLGVDTTGRDSKLPTSLPPPERALTMAFIVLQSESRVSLLETRWGFLPILFSLQSIPIKNPRKQLLKHFDKFYRFFTLFSWVYAITSIHRSLQFGSVQERSSKSLWIVKYLLQLVSRV